MSNNKPTLYTSPSPALLDLYDINNSIVVIIDVFRATSTIATALYNGAKCIIPVDSVAKCIELGRKIEAITAGERDGKIAEGLEYGNSPFEYSKEFIGGKTLVLTTTNGTKLLHMALERDHSTLSPVHSPIYRPFANTLFSKSSRYCWVVLPGKTA